MTVLLQIFSPATSDPLLPLSSLCPPVSSLLGGSGRAAWAAGGETRSGDVSPALLYGFGQQRGHPAGHYYTLILTHTHPLQPHTQPSETFHHTYTPPSSDPNLPIPPK